MDLIRKLDIFGIKPSIYTAKKQEQYRTIAGSIITLLIVGACIYIFFIQIQSLYAMESPFVVESKQIVTDPDQFIFSNEDDFVFGMLIDNKVYDASKYNDFIFQANLVSVSIDQLVQNPNKKKINSYQILPCSQIENYEEKFKNYNFPSSTLSLVQYAFCLDQKQFNLFTNETLQLQGQIGSEIYTIISIWISECTEGSSSGCWDKKKQSSSFAVDNNMQNFQNAQIELRIGVPVKELVPKNFNQPFKTKLKMITLKTEHSLSLKEQVIMQNIQLNTETDFYQFFGKTNEQRNGLQYQQSNQFIIPNNGQNSIFAIDFYLSEEQVCINRTYSNILNVIANVLSLFNVVSAVARFCLKFFYTLILESSITLNYMNPPNQSNRVNPEHVIYKNNKKVTIGQIYTLFRRSYSWLYQGIEDIQGILSIQQLVHNFYEIQLLKHLLLTDEQRLIVRYSKKPNLIRSNQNTLERGPQFTRLEQDLLMKDPVIDDENLLYEAYKKIKDRGTSIDQNILALTEENLANKWDEKYQQESQINPMSQQSQVNPLSPVQADQEFNQFLKIEDNV